MSCNYPPWDKCIERIRVLGRWENDLHSHILPRIFWRKGSYNTEKIRKVFAYDATSNLSMFVRSLLLKMVSKRSKTSWKTWINLLFQPQESWTVRSKNASSERHVPCVFHVHRPSAPIVPFLWVAGAEQRALYTHVYVYIYIWVVPSPLPVIVAIDGEWFPTKNVIILVVTVTGQGNSPISMYIQLIFVWISHGKHPLKVQKPRFLIGCFTTTTLNVGFVSVPAS